VFPSLVLEHTSFPTGILRLGETRDYQRVTDAGLPTEHLYLDAGGIQAHTFYAPDSLPTATNGQIHTFLLVGDHLGSTTVVIDHDTGELVEKATYQPYGQVESDYRPPRWDSLREDVRYTGHWDDAQVGLVYFGNRYYAPQLGRWLSPDPLAIHAAQGDLNLWRSPGSFVPSAPPPSRGGAVC
jgi:RHS repeat-associated protein